MDKAVTPFSNARTSNSHRLIGIVPPLLVISVKNGGLNNASAGEFVNTAYAYALFVLGNKRSWRKSKLDYLVLGGKDSIVIDRSDTHTNHITLFTFGRPPFHFMHFSI